MDGIGKIGVSPRDLYNKVNGNQEEFVKQWQAEYEGNPFMAAKIYNYVASMDTDGTPGLTPEEYKQGLSDKKALAEIKLDKINSQYVAKEDIESFAKMGQEEKLNYIESKIQYGAGKEAEAHITASIILSSINRLETEIKLIEEEQDIVKTQEETQKALEKADKEDQQNNQKENLKSIDGLG